MKLEIFKPEDYEWTFRGPPKGKREEQWAAMSNHRLNEWLDKNATITDSTTKTEIFISVPKEKCDHPKEKILGRIGRKEDHWTTGGVTFLSKGLVRFNSYECECGAAIEPKEFEEIK